MAVAYFTVNSVSRNLTNSLTAVQCVMEVHRLHSSQTLLGYQIKYLRWVWHGEMRNAYNISIGKCKGKRLL